MIAVIDDDKIVRDAIHTLALSLGYHASTFASASEFLQSEHVHDTSCLITDVRIPRLTGIELQGRPKSRPVADSSSTPRKIRGKWF